MYCTLANEPKLISYLLPESFVLASARTFLLVSLLIAASPGTLLPFKFSIFYHSLVDYLVAIVTGESERDTEIPQSQWLNKLERHEKMVDVFQYRKMYKCITCNMNRTSFLIQNLASYKHS